ncbi:gliding motility-associated C-terminal domain-containing protein [bacterium]|nr:gliding motility-associated C-terminal domain-containing protein [bacterium]
MNRFLTILFVIFLVFPQISLNAQEGYGTINQTAIIFVHGQGGSGTKKSLADSLEKYLEGPLYDSRNSSQENRLFFYQYSFDDNEGRFWDQGYEIGNQENKWIHACRKKWNKFYNHELINGYDPNHENLITSPYPRSIILITHSQGGLSARAYLTDENNWRTDSVTGHKVLDVTKIITGNCPHSGSDLSYLYPLIKHGSGLFVAWAAMDFYLSSLFFSQGNGYLGTAFFSGGIWITAFGVHSTFIDEQMGKHSYHFQYTNPDMQTLMGKYLNFQMQNVEFNILASKGVPTFALHPIYYTSPITAKELIPALVLYAFTGFPMFADGDFIDPYASQIGKTYSGDLAHITSAKRYTIEINNSLDFTAHGNDWNYFMERGPGWGYFLNDWCHGGIYSVNGNTDFSYQNVNKNTSSKNGLLKKLDTSDEDGEDQYEQVDIIRLGPGDLTEDSIITGQIHDFLPHKLRYARVSFNYGEWKYIEMVSNDDFTKSEVLNEKRYIRDMYGNFKIKIEEHVLEGQNIFIFESENDYGITDWRMLRLNYNPVPLYAIPKFPMPRSSINPILTPLSIRIDSDRTDYEDDPKSMIDYRVLKIGMAEDSLENLENIIDFTTIDTSSGSSTVCSKLEYSPDESIFSQEGEYKIYTKIIHDSGEENPPMSQTYWNFWIDKTRPVISIDELKPFSPDGEKKMLVAYNLEDNISESLNSVRITLCDVSDNEIDILKEISYQGIGRRFFEWDGDIEDGEYLIKITASDVAGNVGVNSTPIIIDTVVPKFLEYGFDPENKIFTKNDYSLDFLYKVSEDCTLEINLISHDNVLSKYPGLGYYTLNNGPQDMNDDGIDEENMFSFNGLNAPKDGKYQLKIRMMDFAGNQSDWYSMSDIIVDRTSPIISKIHSMPFIASADSEPRYEIKFRYDLSEDNDEEINKDGSNIIVKGEIMDSNSGEGLKEFEGVGNSIYDTNEIVFIVSEGWNSGKYQFRMTATDSKGNSSTASADFVKDAVPPEISFPEEGSEVFGKITIKGRAMDPDWTNSNSFRAYRIYFKAGSINSISESLADESLIRSGWVTNEISVPKFYMSTDNTDPYYGKAHISSASVLDDGILAYWNTNVLQHGQYTLLLVAEEEGVDGKRSCVLRNINIIEGESTDPLINISLSDTNIIFPGSMLEIKYGLENKDSDVDIEILDSSGRLVYYEHHDNISSSQYAGTPVIIESDPGYYYWQDEDDFWHIFLNSSNGNNTFSGTIVTDGIFSDTSVLLLEEGVEFSGGLLNLNVNLENNSGEIVFKSSGEYIVSNIEFTGNPGTENIYIGKKILNPFTNPFSLEDLTSPQTVSWNGKYFDTDSFVNNGDYTVRVTASSVDNNGYGYADAVVHVETIFDIAVDSPAPDQIYSFTDPGSSTVSFTPSEDAAITVVIFDYEENDSEKKLSTLISDKVFKGGTKHHATWDGTCDPEAFTAPEGTYKVKFICTPVSENNSFEEYSSVINVSHSDCQSGTSTAVLEIEKSGNKVNGIDVARSTSDFVVRTKPEGRYFPSLEFSWSANLQGKQLVTVYPYYPFALQVHRKFNKVKVRIKGELHGMGINRECKSDCSWHSFFDNFMINFTADKTFLTDPNDSTKCQPAVLDLTYSPSMIGWKTNCCGTVKTGDFTHLNYTKSKFQVYKGTETVEKCIGLICFDVEVPQYFTIQNNCVYQPVDQHVEEFAPFSQKGWWKLYYPGSIDVHLKYNFISWDLNPLNNRYYTWFGYVNKNRAVFKDVAWRGDEWKEILVTAEIDQNDRYGGRNWNHFRREMEVEYNRWLNFPDKSIDYYLFNQSIEYNPVISDNGELGVHLVQDPVYSKKHYVYCDKEISPETDEMNSYSVDWPLTLEELDQIDTDNRVILSEIQSYVNPESAPDDYTKDLIEYNDSPPETSDQYHNIPIDDYNPGKPPFEIDTNSIDMDCQNGELGPVTSIMNYNESLDGYFFKSEDILKFFPDYYTNDYYNKIIIVNLLSTITVGTQIEGIIPELIQSNSNEFKTALKAIFPTYDSTWTPLEDPLLTRSDGWIESGLHSFSLPSSLGAITKIFHHIDLYPWNLYESDNNKSCFLLEGILKKDNPHTIIDDWIIECQYPDGSINNDFSTHETHVNKIDNINDRFNMKLNLMASGKEMIEIKGNAFGDEFESYAVYSYSDGHWDEIATSHTAVGSETETEAGTLCWWDVTGIRGPQSLLLEITNSDGSKNIANLSINVGSYIDDSIGTVSASYDRINLNYDAGTFKAPDVISVSASSLSELDYDLDIIPFGPMVQVKAGEENEEFNYPATLTYYYTNEEIEESGINKNTISLYAIKPSGEFEKLENRTFTQSGDLWILSAEISSPVTVAPLNSAPPIKPVLDEIASLTNKNSISISGTADSRYEIEILVDDDPDFIDDSDNTSAVGKTFNTVEWSVDGDTVRFELSDIGLPNEGDNYIFVTYKNIESRTFEKVYVVRDTVSPEINDLEIIPNPFFTDITSKTSVDISISEPGNIYFYLYDIYGEEICRKILQANEGNAIFEWDGMINGDLGPSGYYLCRFFCVDLAGNHAEEKMEYIAMNCDPMPVITDLSVSPNPFSYEVFDNTEVAFTIYEELRLSINIYDLKNNHIKELCNNTLLQTGRHSFAWDGTDQDFNEYVRDDRYTLVIDASSPHGVYISRITESIEIDTNPPEVYISVGDPSNYVQSEEYHAVSSDTLFTISSDDFGINNYVVDDIKFRIDENPWMEYTEPFNFSDYSSEVHRIWYRSTDHAFNTSSERYIDASIYSHEPDIELVVGEPKIIVDNNINISSITPLSFRSSDRPEELVEVMFSINGNDWKEHRAPFTFEGYPGGEYTIEYFAVNPFGSNSPVLSSTIILDTSGPIVNILPYDRFISPNCDGIKDILHINGTASDSFGVADWEFKILNSEGSVIWNHMGSGSNLSMSWDGTDMQSTITCDGSYPYEMILSDNIGNISTFDGDGVIVDTCNPHVNTITTVPETFSPNADGCNDFMEFSVDTVDALSGIQNCSVYIFDGITANPGESLVEIPCEFIGDIYHCVWDGKDNDGNDLSEGRYYYGIRVSDLAGNAYFEQPSEDRFIAINHSPLTITYMSDVDNITENTAGVHSIQPMWAPDDMKIVYNENYRSLYTYDPEYSHTVEIYQGSETVTRPIWISRAGFSSEKVVFEKPRYDDPVWYQRGTDLISVDPQTLEFETVYTAYYKIVYDKVALDGTDTFFFTSRMPDTYRFNPVDLTYFGLSSPTINGFDTFEPCTWDATDDKDRPATFSFGYPAISQIGPGPIFDTPEYIAIAPMTMTSYRGDEHEYPYGCYEVDERKDLCLLSDDMDGERLWLTDDTAVEKYPRFSPDATRIAYVSDASGYSNIWIIEREIPYGGYIQPYNTNNFSQAIQITFFLDDKLDPDSVRWTADGEMLTFTRTAQDDPNEPYIQKDVYVCSHNGSGLEEIFGYKMKRTLPYSHSVPEWSSSGRVLAYTEYNKEMDKTDIYFRYFYWDDPCQPKEYNIPGIVQSLDESVTVLVEEDDLYQFRDLLEISIVEENDIPSFEEIEESVRGDVYEITTQSQIHNFSDNIDISFKLTDLEASEDVQVYTYYPYLNRWDVAQPDLTLVEIDFANALMTIKMPHLSYYALVSSENEFGTPEILGYSVSSNVFSPNDDGKLDLLSITASVSEKSVLFVEVYDSTGEKVFMTQAETVDEIPITITWDGSSISGGLAPDGEYTIKTFAVDLMGLSSDTIETTVKLDTTPPVTQALVDSEKLYIENNDVYAINGASVILTGNDALAGILSTEYSFDGILWGDYGYPVTLETMTDGYYPFYYRSTDRVFNTENDNILDLYIDTTAPESTGTFVPSILSEGILKVIQGSCFHIGSEDGEFGSGIKYTQFRIDGDMWLNYTGDVDISMLGYGVHIMEFFSVDNLDNTEDAKSIEFEVVPAFDIDVEISSMPRVLVWLNKETVSDSAGAALDELLSGHDIMGYSIVDSQLEFVSAMRTGMFNEYVILGNYENLEGHTSEELREHVYSGKGLITSHYYHFLGEGDSPEVLGIKFNGVYDGQNLCVNILNSPITHEGILLTSGEMYKIESNGCFNAGYASISGSLPTPVIVGNSYGMGRTVYIAFDLFQSLDMAGGILQNAMKYLTPEHSQVDSNDLVGVGIEVESKVVDLDVSLTGIFTESCMIIETQPTAEVESNVSVWSDRLNTGERKAYHVLIEIPEDINELSAEALLKYKLNGIWWDEPPVVTDFNVEQSSDMRIFIDDIIEHLFMIEVESKEEHLISNAAKCLIKVQNLHDLDEMKEKSILECVKAINYLRRISSADITEARILLDRLLIKLEQLI